VITNYYGEEVDCSSQVEVDAAVAAGKVPRVSANISIEIKASFRIKITAGAALLTILAAAAPRIETWGASAPRIETRETSAPSIVTWGTSAPSIETWGTSAPRIVTRETSAPRIETWGASAPRIETRETSAPSIVTWGTSAPSIVTWETSAPSIVANGSSQLRVKGKLKVTAGQFVAIVAIGSLPEILGGGFVRRLDLSTPQNWCEHYGAEVHGDYALIFKGLNEKFQSEHRSFLYQPGESQTDPNWDPDPRIECGNGLHFSPTPRHTLEFAPSAKKFVGCLVPLASILVHPDGEYPQKVRAPATVGCWECDIDGKWIGELKPDFSKYDAPVPVAAAARATPKRQSKAKKKPKAKKRGSR